MRRQADALTQLGVELDVVSISGDRGRLDYYRGRERVREAIRRFRPELVHVHFGYTILATSRELPRVVSFYGDDLNGESVGRPGAISLKSRLGLLVSQFAARAAERSVAVSEGLRQRIRSSAARERCEVIRDSVDTTLFRPIPQGEARERLGVSGSAKLVLFPHSPAQRTKRPDLAKAAVEVLRERDADVELWSVSGRSPDEMPLYYAAADLLIVTSDLEGGPSCVKEALACGLPVVSVPVGDVRVLKESHRLCFLADRDPHSLADAIERALSLRGRPRLSQIPAALQLSNAASRLMQLYLDAQLLHANGMIRRRHA